jgi:SAM-dependent methyltransferase
MEVGYTASGTESNTGLEGRTWHHGLVARWWANKSATDEELAGYGSAIRRFGEPALDLACGTGRLLVPLLERGLDVDGADISEDMLGWCRERAATAGVSPTLWAQAMHELELPRHYRTIFICDSFGIGGSRAHDRQALRRIHDHLAPGGALVMSTGFPYDDEDEWLLWLPGRRDAALPREWPTEPGRQALADGDELQQRVRLVDLDPRAQRIVLEIEGRLVRDGTVVNEERRQIAISTYFEQELRLILELAGFTSVEFQAGYTGRPATADDAEVLVIATRPP